MFLINTNLCVFLAQKRESVSTHNPTKVGEVMGKYYDIDPMAIEIKVKSTEGRGERQNEPLRPRIGQTSMGTRT